ncbi:MAG: signal recognition particle-docking protein FtsY [Thaumarchaeota archaeon]|nr:signal recognition particle-docking protein FtsY [Nitrososphaerota archaeon]
MFEKLRNAFSSAVKSLGEKELKEKDIEEVLFELEIALLESDVATEVIDMIKSDLKGKLVGTTVQKDKIDEFVKESLRESISSMFDSTARVDIISNIRGKKEKGEPYVILFMGINGTGKTTTIAKFANLLRENKLSSVIAAADTYRAGAIEQISEHGKRLNIKVIAQNYGSDPAAVSRDAVLYAKSHKVDCVLIDTAGRMQTSKNLMDQMSKINKVVNPDLKLFVGDSLAGNDTVSQAREFHNYAKFDGAILTKSDADARGGAAISIVKITSAPILYLGVGQEYQDLRPFDKMSFLDSLFGPESVSEISTQQKPQQKEDKVTDEKISDEMTTRAEVKQEQAAPRAEVKQEQAAPRAEVKQEQAAPRAEVKQEQAAPRAEVKQEAGAKTAQDGEGDPFAGIATNDIEDYSGLYDVAPPESDEEARQMASKIRKWVSDGRPKPGKKAEMREEETSGELSREEKSKKKRSMFGWMKK